MPKGQAAVRWSPELDSKLLLTIIAVQNIQIDYNAVAKAFGKCSHLGWVRWKLGILDHDSCTFGFQEKHIEFALEQVTVSFLPYDTETD